MTGHIPPHMTSTLPRLRLHLLPASPVLVLFAVVMFCAGCKTTQPNGPSRPASPQTAGSPADSEVQLQIFLDNAGFGPGTIDGRSGEFTAKALVKYLKANGLPGDTTPAQIGATKISPVYTTYVVTEADVRSVGSVADTPELQAKQKSMPYKSVAERVAERYHTSIAFLQKLNPSLNTGSLPAGTVLTVPNVSPFDIDSVPETGKVAKNSALAGRRIHIDTSIRMLEVIEGDRLVAAFPITPGSASLPAPKGDWKIVGIATKPWFRYDEGVLERGERTEKFFMIPAGPNNPVGVLWMGLSKPGIGIHGTNTPITIGRAGSHGCIRMANWDAARMPSLVTT